MGERNRFFGNVLVKLLASCLAQDVEQQLKTNTKPLSGSLRTVMLLLGILLAKCHS